jgi:hypothetical protein
MEYDDSVLVKELPLNTRVRNALLSNDYGNNYPTVWHIRNELDAVLLRTPNIGYKSIKEIRKLVPYRPDDKPEDKPLFDIYQRVKRIEKLLEMMDYRARLLLENQERSQEIWNMFRGITTERLSQIEKRLGLLLAMQKENHHG